MKKLWSLALFLLLLLVSSCSNTVGDMLDDYNSNFEVENTVEDDTLPTPNDPDFDASQMLEKIYYVSYDDTFTVCAPYDCSYYSWRITNADDDTNTPLSVQLLDGKSLNSRVFAAYIAESGLTAGKTYKIKLEVHDRKGYAYYCYSELVIYEHYLYLED